MRGQPLPALEGLCGDYEALAGSPDTKGGNHKGEDRPGRLKIK